MLHLTFESCTLSFRYLTKEPHLAGTRRNLKLATFIRDQWISNFFDKVYLKDYYVCLSYARKPGKVILLNSNKKILFQAKTTEKAFFKEENHTGNVYPFHAYSASGDIEVNSFGGYVTYCINNLSQSTENIDKVLIKRAFIFFLSGLLFKNIHNSQDSRGRDRLFL